MLAFPPAPKLPRRANAPAMSQSLSSIEHIVSSDSSEELRPVNRPHRKRPAAYEEQCDSPDEDSPGLPRSSLAVSSSEADPSLVRAEAGKVSSQIPPPTPDAGEGINTSVMEG